MSNKRESINPYAFSIGIFSIIILVKLASYLTPYKLYFSFSSFIYDQTNTYRWESLIIKLAIPSIVGFFLYYIPFQWIKLTGGSIIGYRVIFRYLSQQSSLSAKAVGFFSALLLAWPFIAFWDILMHPLLHEFKLQFYCIYFLYFMSYSYFSEFGINIAKIILKNELPSAETHNLSGKLAFFENIRISFIGIIISGIATYLASILGAAK